VTRAAVLEVADRFGLVVRQETLTVERLTHADEAFLTATTREVTPLVRIDGRSVGNGAPGSMTLRLLDGYRDLVRSELADD
jgi:branched-subunit amino acid aminotransferase/4-amino-4-deoxychorismate lyase